MTPTLSPERTEKYGAVLDLLAEKLLVDEATMGIEFPYVTDPQGRWETLPASQSACYTGQAWSHGNWFCGSWVGLLLAAHLRTGNAELLALAR